LRARGAGDNPAGGDLWAVGPRGAPTAGLARQTGLAATHAVEDTEGVLSDTYHPATLTAVLVGVDGSVATVARDRGRGFGLTVQMRSLVPQPGGTGTASVAAGPTGGQHHPARYGVRRPLPRVGLVDPEESTP